MRNFITLIAGTILALHLTACTSKPPPDEGGGDGIDQAAQVDDALEKVDSPQESVDQAGGDNFLDENLPENALGEQEKKTEVTDTPPPEAAPADPAAPPPADPAAPPPADAVAGVDTGSTPPPAETVASAPEATTPPPEDKPKPAPVPLKKVETVPFHKGEILANAVYIVRPGDSYKKIAKMVYGDEARAKEIKKVNSGKTVRQGEKIYYNSPTRPTDETKISNFYEDSGINPEKYVTVEGDNLKKLG